MVTEESVENMDVVKDQVLKETEDGQDIPLPGKEGESRYKE